MFAPETSSQVESAEGARQYHHFDTQLYALTSYSNRDLLIPLEYIVRALAVVETVHDEIQ